jgi:hypothetical protein
LLARAFDVVVGALPVVSGLRTSASAFAPIAFFVEADFCGGAGADSALFKDFGGLLASFFRETTAAADFAADDEEAAGEEDATAVLAAAGDAAAPRLAFGDAASCFRGDGACPESNTGP